MRESLQTGLSRGRRSRNKVSVGEPAEGSFQQQSKHKTFYTAFTCSLQNELGALRYLAEYCSVLLNRAFKIRFGEIERLKIGLSDFGSEG